MFRRFLLPALAVALPATDLPADTVKLKSGEVVEGRVVQRDPTGITVEVQYSPTIAEQRFIPKADIVAAEIASSDELAFAPLRDLKPPETAVDVAAYDVILDEKLNPFLKKYSFSPRVADVKVIVSRFTEERKRVASGEIKVAGTWYSAAAYAEEKYQIDAARLYLAMQAQLAAKNYPAVLNAFEVLKRNYPASLAFADAVSLAREALPKFQQQLNFAVNSLPATLAQRQAAIDRTPVEQRAPIARAIAEENARAEATWKAAEKAQQRFVPIVLYDAKSLTAMQNASRDLTKQLADIDPKIFEGAKLVRTLQAEITANEAASAATSIARVKATWPNYEALRRLELRLQNMQAKPSPSPAKSAL